MMGKSVGGVYNNFDDEFDDKIGSGFGCDKCRNPYKLKRSKFYASNWGDTESEDMGYWWCRECNRKYFF